LNRCLRIEILKTLSEPWTIIFHGKSCGSLSLMGKWEYREPFLPLLPGIHFVEFGDAEAVEDELYKADATGNGMAAVVLEPGEDRLRGRRMPREAMEVIG